MDNRSQQAWSKWLLHEFVGPLVCFVCLYAGVLSSTALPAATVALLLPTYIATTSLAVTPLAALVLAACRFRHAWRRWQQARRDALGARMLNAFSDGVQWLPGTR